MVIVGETTCKGIMNKSGIEGVDYAINPYIGCTHSCVYCYARFMTRWYHKGEKWGTFVDVKKNAVECLQKEVKNKRLGTILLSSVTDAYQPVEKKYMVTRNLLKTLEDHSFPVQILTKSSLVLRDMDVLSNINQSEVGFTITFADDKYRKIFEPGASPIPDRLDALKQFSDIGIGTMAFLGPMLPYLSEENLVTLMNTLADRTSRVIVDRLNIKAGNWKSIEETLMDNLPEVIDKIKVASKKESTYYDEFRPKIIKMLEKRAIPADILF